jgi:exoribonuclease R
MTIETKVKIYIEDRNYTTWMFQDMESNEEISITEYPFLKTFSPIEQKLFTKDVVLLSQNTITPLYSAIKTKSQIAGVLILEKNKTYGRTNKKRLLYKCIPDDSHLPVFLLPFDVKIEFSKIQRNKYVVFEFDHWNDKHPQGKLLETIGDVDNLEAFYEYQLYCKSLHISITDFTNKTRTCLNKQSQDQFIENIRTNPNYQIEDCRERYVFTIDPINSVDFDDGFSIQTVGTNTKITIYIANVFIWLETLGLWNSFSKRVATIYLPDRRRPMLPTILSDTLCSLLENQPRFAFAMEITVETATGKIIATEKPVFKNVIIKVTKNYHYDDPQLLYADESYKELFEITQKMNKHSVKTSHDVVSYWMIKMNCMIGEYMVNNKIGIFRSTILSNDSKHSFETSHDADIDLSFLKEDTRRVIQSWNNNMGKYVIFEEDVILQHCMLNSNYIHFTSPIRRLVDLLNQIMLFNHFGLIKHVSKDSLGFLDNWIRQIEYINTTMRSIRKVQTDCFLLNRCFNEPNILNNEYVGAVFDKIVKNDGTFHYMVYLEDLKLLSRIITHIDLENYCVSTFRLYLFENEDKTKKKIRLQIL